MYDPTPDFPYAYEAIDAIEEQNCSRGCAVPSEGDIRAFGPGGACPVLAMVMLEEPIPELERVGAAIVCTARRRPSDVSVDQLDLGFEISAGEFELGEVISSNVRSDTRES